MRENNDIYFKLFANCIPVKGASRSLLCDVQRNRSNFIPNDLYTILEDFPNKSISEIEAIYGEENKEVLNDYFEFLLNEEYGFFCSAEELQLFPKLNLEWAHPSIITNAIIDVGNVTHDFQKIFSQLEDLNCQDIQIRFFRQASVDEIGAILSLLRLSTIKSVELFVQYNELLTDKEILGIVDHNLRLCNVIFHSAPFKRNFLSNNKTPVYFVKDIISSAAHCGFISQKYFTMNINSFTEAQKNNSCLNKKIAIDENGEIKNCPSMELSYGNIASDTLDSVISENNTFKNYWSIHKDQILVCKDCEFRYICTDCRAYIENPDDLLSKPLKCGYDPYTNEWDQLTDRPLIHAI